MSINSINPRSPPAISLVFIVSSAMPIVGATYFSSIWRFFKNRPNR